MSEMKDFKPYVVKALYEWILDNGMTPLIIVNTGFPGVRIPEGLLGDPGDTRNKVLLNIAPSATAGLAFDIKACEIRFFARFSGASYGVCIPVRCIESIYAKETGEGNVFKMNYDAAVSAPPPAPAPSKNHLRVVK
jgi:stringent starvation protein B